MPSKGGEDVATNRGTRRGQKAWDPLELLFRSPTPAWIG
jgi:hypothetical protein